MDEITSYLEKIENPVYREKFREVMQWVSEYSEDLVGQIKWNQHMFTAHDTFILGFFAAKQHFSVGPEKVVFEEFLPTIEAAGLKHGKKTFQVNFEAEVPYDLLGKIIDQTMILKQDTTTFWLR